MPRSILEESRIHPAIRDTIANRHADVVHNVQAAVKFAIEQALSMKVGAVNVYVQGLNFSDEGK